VRTPAVAQVGDLGVSLCVLRSKQRVGLGSITVTEASTDGVVTAMCSAVAPPQQNPMR
jgi:hypothetical protein